MPAATIAVVVVIAVLGAGAAAFMLIGDGAVGDCVLQYRYEGITRHQGWSQGECNQWCADNLEPAGRAIDCWFEAY
jgi:hypothetical protein